MSFFQDYEGPLTLIAIVLLGRALALKIPTVQHIVGFQQVIMSCFLPALLLSSITALPVSELSTSWRYPVFSLMYCCFLMICIQIIFWLTGCVKLQQERATLLLMFPGLAPGLTSMPYVSVVVAEMAPKTISSGHVGLADLGIKFFVLFVLFLLAVQMSQKTQMRNSARASQRVQVLFLSNSSFCKSMRKLCYGFLTEPVNFASVLGVVLLAAGPIRLQDVSIAGRAIERISNCCAPALFLLIGMKVNLFQKQQGVLLILMLLRSGLGFLFSYLLSITVHSEPNETMFWVFLCNSSLSFWPYTHICKIGEQEERAPQMMCQTLLEDAAQDAHLSEEIRSFFTQLRENLNAGTSNVATTVEEVSLLVTGMRINKSLSLITNGSFKSVSTSCESQSLVTSCNSRGESSSNGSTERLYELVSDLDKVVQSRSTFDPFVAIMALSVSTSWTILSCTILALTPKDFWVSTNALPVIGGTMVFVSVLGLRWIGWQLTNSNWQEAEPGLKGRCMSDSRYEDRDPDEEMPDDRNTIKIHRAAGQLSIMPEKARISTLEACEAYFALEEAASETVPSRLTQAFGLQQQVGPESDPVVNYGLRTTMARCTYGGHDIKNDFVFSLIRISSVSSMSSSMSKSSSMSNSSSLASSSPQATQQSMSTVGTVHVALPPSTWRKDVKMHGLNLQAVKEDLGETQSCSSDSSNSLRQAAQSPTSSLSSRSNVRMVDASLPWQKRWQIGSLAVSTLLGRGMSKADMDLACPSQVKSSLEPSDH